MKLTQQQIDDFNRDGWLFLPELFSAEEVALLAREAEGIYDTQRPEVWREKSGAPRTAFAAHLYNEAFGLLGAHPRMIDPVEQIFGEKAYPTLADVPEPLGLVDVFRPSAQAADVARQAVAAGAKALWLQLGITSEAARQMAADAGLDYVEDRCLAVERAKLELHAPVR